jgi:superfamily I DNA/RNA helicase
MAMMIPPDIEDFKTEGEKRFYNFLESVAKPDTEYIAWYSPDIKEREPDFILFHKGIGLIVFEVKDWALKQIIEAYPDRFVIKKGNKKETNKNPLEQAKNYLYKLKDKIQDDGKLIEKDLRYKGKSKIPINYGVVFTNINKYNYCQKNLDKIGNVHKLFFWDDLHPESDICRDKSGKCFRETIVQKFPPLFPCRISKAELNHLVGLIYPKVILKLPEREGDKFYSQRIHQIQILDRNQESLARQFDGGHRIIKGPSGTGKTIILVHKADFLQQYNPAIKTILFVCYNLTLVNYIKRLLTNKNMAVGKDGVEVYSFYDLCGKLLDMPIDHENKDTEYYNTIIGLVSELEESGCKYDAILVDEGQDFSDGMFKVVKALLNKNTNNLTIAIDDNQNIYKRKQSWEKLGINAVGGRTKTIKHVYRNTIEIAEFASKFISDNSESHKKAGDTQIEICPGFNDAHGPKPLLLQFSNMDKIIDYVAEGIRDISINQKIPLSEIAIIYSSSFYQNPSLPELPNMFESALDSKGILSNWISQDYRSKKLYDLTTNRVAISSIHSIKGFDYSCVFLIGLGFMEEEKWTKDQIEKMIYVAITRARDQLFIPYVNKTSQIERLINCL